MLSASKREVREFSLCRNFFNNLWNCVLIHYVIQIWRYNHDEDLIWGDDELVGHTRSIQQQTLVDVNKIPTKQTLTIDRLLHFSTGLKQWCCVSESYTITIAHSKRWGSNATPVLCSSPQERAMVVSTQRLMWLGGMRRWGTAVVITKTRPFKVCKHVLYTEMLQKSDVRCLFSGSQAGCLVNGSEVQYVPLCSLGRPIIAEMFQVGLSVWEDSWWKEDEHWFDLDWCFPSGCI